MFFKKDGEDLLQGAMVTTPSLTLTEDTKDEFTYPQEGWYWFDSLDTAIKGFASMSASATVAEYTLNGTVYNVPLDVDAQNTVTAVTVAKMSGVLSSTVIYFSNGVKMPITADEWLPFAIWFATKRNEKFLP